MKFFNPIMLNFLWFVPVLIGILLLFWRHKKEMMHRFADENTIEHIAPHISARKSVAKSVLFIVTYILLVVALARPQWGYQWQEIKRQGIDVILAIDVSKSMLTQDVLPNRLDRVKLAVRDLLKQMQGDRIGLVAFAGQAFMVCPLTMDYNGFLLSLDDLSINTIPRGGTNVGEAIKEAIKGYENTPSKHKAVIIITDGDNLEGKPLELADKAKEAGIKIFTVGVGTVEGEMVRIKDAQGQMQFLKDNAGNFVKSRLNESLLQQIALKTQGAYVRAGGANFGLDVIYHQELTKLEKREIQSRLEKKYHERYQWPLAVALLLLTIETVMGNKRQE